MSAGVVPKEGWTAFLQALTDGLAATAHLYTNDPDLDEDTTSEDFVEPVWEAYLPLGITRWTPAAMKGGVAFSVADHLVWLWEGGPVPVPIQGVYLTAGPVGRVLFAWRRPGDPYRLGPDNPVLTVLVTLTFPPPS